MLREDQLRDHISRTEKKLTEDRVESRGLIVLREAIVCSWSNARQVFTCVLAKVMI